MSTLFWAGIAAIVFGAVLMLATTIFGFGDQTEGRVSKAAAIIMLGGAVAGYLGLMGTS